jgi:imidazole glycerol-phosphate synthase subunit HisH
MSKVTLVDYGVGNISAFAHIYERLNLSYSFARTGEQIMAADKLILPGVGSFDWAMTKLNQSGMRDALDKKVLDKKAPVIGVCVGMQMMANSSDEGKLEGLGWINAHVAKMKPVGNHLTPLPHMGWNDVQPAETKNIFKGIADPRFYFLHSYVVEPVEPKDVLATTRYGATYVCAVHRGNVFGTQFHPEKSHQWGISLLRNFAEL